MSDNRPQVKGGRRSEPRPPAAGSSANPAISTVAGIIAVALAVGFLLIVVSRAMGDSGNGPASPVVGETPDATAELSATNTVAAATATDEATSSPTAEPTVEETETPTASTPNGGDDDQLPLIDCTDMFAPADKEHRMGEGCQPGDLVLLPDTLTNGGTHYLRAGAAAAFQELVDAAAAEGYTLYTVSAFRSYETQVYTYQANVDAFGQEYADRVSAKPGRSEHQLGTTVDVVSPGHEDLAEAWGDTAEGAWVAANAWKYGFVISYPAGKEHITGYSYEPWHLRWVGVDVAAQVIASGLTLREYLAR